MPQYWFIAEALVTLHAHCRRSAGHFTRDHLKAWSEKFRERPTGVQHAIDHLERCGMVRRAPGVADEKRPKPGVTRFILTAEGAAAAKAAAQAHHYAGLSAAAKKGAAMRPRPKGTFAAKLWALFRMRRAITAAEAAATLVDAGANVATGVRTASQYLRLWARLCPQHIQVSKQKGPAGAYRFVMVADFGPHAPAVTTPTGPEGGATA